MAKLGEDVTEVLDYVPGHFQVIRHVRPKFACRACDAITQTAKLNGVNPEAYLRDTLTKIAEGHPINKIDALMPWKMTPAEGAA